MTLSDDMPQKGLESLRRAVAEALERKRRLGQYAVFWRNGQVVFEGPDAPQGPENPEPGRETGQGGDSVGESGDVLEGLDTGQEGHHG